MKQFLLIMVLLGMGAHASSNPFDLQVNLQKIDQDQDILLTALKEMAEQKEAQVALEEEAPTPAKLIEDLVVEEKETSLDQSEGSDAVEESLPEKKISEDVSQQNEVSLEEKRLKKVKAEQARIEQTRKEQASAEQSRLAAIKAEEERLEVEAYEAQRLVKQKEAEEKIVADKVAMVKEAAEKVAAEKEALKKEELLRVEKEKAPKHAIVDINITREALDAKEKADQAYLEAIREMR